MKEKIFIIGGGLAGLSAAIYAIRSGLSPVIVEKNRHLGGRVRSFHAPDLGRTIDNGQHLLSAAYTETRRMLAIIETSDKIEFQKRFEASFIRDRYSRMHFKAFRLPSPWHFFGPLLMHRRFTGIPLTDFINFRHQQQQLKPDDLKELTVAEWLERCAQGKSIRELLWYPLCLSILNTHPDRASAALLSQTIQHSFLGPASQAGLGIPLAWLSDIFADPAEAYIRKNGGEIQLLTGARRIEIQDDRVKRIHTSKGTFDASAIVVAVPPHSLFPLLDHIPSPRIRQIQDWSQKLSYHPIMTINFYLSEPFPFKLPASLIASPLQWIFAHPKPDPGLYGYTAVISAADEWSGKNREEIIRMLRDELERITGTTPNIMDYKIITEKRATVSQDNLFVEGRPDNHSGISGLYLAGDWTDTGLPATIEGAVLSGKLAVEAAVANMN